VKFNEDEYYRASVERMRQARAIHDSDTSYAFSTYARGLAAERMLRAFRWKKDRSFEGRHDLEDLLKSSELLTINDGRPRCEDISDDEKHLST